MTDAILSYEIGRSAPDDQPARRSAGVTQPRSRRIGSASSRFTLLLMALRHSPVHTHPQLLLGGNGSVNWAYAGDRHG